MTRGWYANLWRTARLALGVLALIAGSRAAPASEVVPPPPATQVAPRVAAASDLKFALDDIAAAFTNSGGPRIEAIYGSSGTLTQQLLTGAPYDAFLSADEGFVFQLADAGLTVDRGELYAVGRIVVFAPRGSPLQVDPELEGVREWLKPARPSRNARFAIANPAHAPYGRAAEAALRKAGLWARIEPRLALGENIAQAAQFATTGGAVGGILAYSLVLAPPLKDRGAFALIPASAHPPLRQRMVLLKRAGPDARRFYEYLRQPAARAILERYGFALPGQLQPDATIVAPPR